MKYTWLVEKYLEGELSGEALRKFELEILRKPEVAEEVERVRSMYHFMKEQHSKFQDSMGLIEDYEDSEHVIDEEIIRQDLDGLKIKKISAGRKDVKDLKKRLAELKVGITLLDHHSSKVLVRKVSVWLAAASVAILLATSSLLLVGKIAPADYAAVYEQFYAAQAVDLSARSLDPVPDDSYRMALNQYDQQNYEMAYQLFNDIPEASPPNIHYYLYKGITAMELGDFQAAIRLFANLQSDAVMKHDGMWYTGLSYLGMEDIPSARAVFEEIIAADNHYKKQAKKLLRNI